MLPIKDLDVDLKEHFLPDFKSEIHVIKSVLTIR